MVKQESADMETTERDVDLGLDDKVVSRCCIDTAFSFEVVEKSSRMVIRIGGRMNIEHEGIRLSLSGERPQEAGRASILVGKTIVHAIGCKDGSLDVSFTDGSRLVVPIDPNYEAWEASATNGFMVVSLPGGCLSAWKSR